MKAGWEVAPLGELCDFQRGLTYGKGDEVDISDNVVLRATNIDLATNLLSFDELKYINDNVVVPDSKKVRKGSLLICTASGSKSHLGKVAYIDDDYGYAFGGFMGMVTPKSGLLPRFLFHMMTSAAYKDFISALSDGANINNLKFDDLRHFEVPHPPLPEQRRIAGILDETFEGIAEAKAAAEKNLQNARALFESHLHSVFTRRGPGWVEKPLEDVVAADCSLSYGIVQPGADQPDGLPIVRPTDLSAHVIELAGLKRIDQRLAAGYKRTALRGGELLICVRGTTGVVSIASPELTGANVTRGIVPVRFDVHLISQRFGYYALAAPTTQRQIREKTYGAALMQINIRDLRNIRLAFPSLSEQDVLADNLDSLATETQRLSAIYSRKIAALEELKSSILHEAISGRLTERAA